MRGGALAAGLTTLAFAAAAWAGAIEFGPVDKNLGDLPVALAVATGDRVVMAVQATDPPVVGWFDTQDWRDDARQINLGASDLESIRCVEAAGDSADPLLLIGGSGVVIAHVDDSASPATITTESPLAVDGTIAAMAWDANREVAYGADDVNGSIHWIPVTGASGNVDSEDGWELLIPGLTPVDLAMADADTLLVVGDADGAPMAVLVDVSNAPPSYEKLDLPTTSATAVAVDADADSALAWILLADGTVIDLIGEVVGDDDDSAGDDDDSAGDDDDSAGDDDDSAGDDDDSAGDDDDSAGDDDDSAGDDDDSAGDDDDSAGDDDDSAVGARADSWSTAILSVDGPTSSADLVHVDGLVHVVGGTEVRSIDMVDGTVLATFDLTGPGVAIAASSADDGHVYVALETLNQVSILGAGPFVSITDVSTTEISSSSDSIDVTFTAGGVTDSGTCTYEVILDGTIALEGTLLTPTGEATLGESTTFTIDGADLTAGNHRVFVVCGDAEGDRGRASFTYYMGELEAPSDFNLTPADGRVEVSWTDSNDENVDHYVVYFSDVEFGVGDTPTTTTTDGNTTSGYSVALPTTLGDTVTSEVSPLANDTTYWFAVAAVDAEGSEGPRTDVLSATPGATGGVAALTGDPGCTCNTSSPTRSPLLLFVLGLPLLALARRRPRSNR